MSNYPTEKEVKDLRGVELTYVFGERNGESLAGLRTPAYVAQADIKKGITIMGEIPEEARLKYPKLNFPAEDAILQCCNSLGDPDDVIYLDTLSHYTKMINDGYFYPDKLDSGLGRNASRMEDACPF